MPGGAVTQDLTGVSPGDYTVTVTDSGGCVVQYTDTVRSPVPISVDIEKHTPIICPGDSDGALEATVTGGTEPYSYVWDDPGAQTTSLATNLEAGVYMVSVTDSRGCMEYDTDTLTEPDVLSLVSLIDNWNEVDSIGTITISIAGGVPDYTYTLIKDGTDTIEQATVSELVYTVVNLEGGNYNITVDDQCGGRIDTLLSPPLTIGDLQLGYDLLLYPNPSTGQFTVEMDNPDREDIDLEIINLMGQRVFRQLYESYGESRFIQTLDLSDQASGAYFMRINGLPVKAKLMIE
jgi:hypothetical protein